MSDISQSTEPPVVSHVTPPGTHVLICDWNSKIQWISGSDLPLGVGDPAWGYLEGASRERAQDALGKVIALRQEIVLEVENKQGIFLRLWIWPLGTPEMAVCILAVAMPKTLQLLSERERESLRLLATGNSAKQIAQTLSVSLSTVHTYFRRCREKLGLDGMDALVGFAARYCQPCSVAQSIVERMPPSENANAGESPQSTAAEG